MFCSKCGKEIDNDAVICVHCGVPTQNFNKQNSQNQNPQTQPIVINNSSSASSSAANFNGISRRHYSLLLDIILICCTGGLWIIWMVLRPKYY